MESRSKFACLNIDDDSDEEFTREFVPIQSLPRRKGVHAIEKRPKAKKGNKEKVVDPTTGLVVQGVDENYASEQKYREDLKQALRESSQMAAKQNKTPSPEKATPPPAPPVEVKEEQSPSMIDKILASIDEESRKQTTKSSLEAIRMLILSLLRCIEASLLKQWKKC
ncbi:hypothetical protein COOONC_23925 [Cooperia oncophora]